jgi:hypothetical protein
MGIAACPLTKVNLATGEPLPKLAARHEGVEVAVLKAAPDWRTSRKSKPISIWYLIVGLLGVFWLLENEGLSEADIAVLVGSLESEDASGSDTNSPPCAYARQRSYN